MKSNIYIYSIILLSAIVHVTPAICIAGIVEGDDLIRAISTGFLIASCITLGYVHGLNRTLG